MAGSDRANQMNVLGSLSVVLLLVGVHWSVQRWRFLDGPRAHIWLSVSSGTALAYVFTYLLPKLATVQMSITTQLHNPLLTLFRHHAYLLALAGLMTFFLLDRSVQESAASKQTRPSNRVFGVQLIGFSLYNLQVGYLIADLPRPSLASYILVGLVFGLHLMGVDHHLYRHGKAAYQDTLRWYFMGATMVGWAIGVLTHALASVVMLVSTFIAGGVMILAIREELPDVRRSSPLAFVIAVSTASAVIIALQTWQSI